MPRCALFSRLRRPAISGAAILALVSAACAPLCGCAAHVCRSPMCHGPHRMWTAASGALLLADGGGGDGDWKVANSKVAFRHNFGSSCTRSVHCCAGYRVWCCVWVMYVVRIVFNGYSMYSTLKFKVQGLPSEHENPSFLAKIAFWLPKFFSLRGPTMVGRAAAGPSAQTSATIHSLQVESFTPTITVTFATLLQRQGSS